MHSQPQHLRGSLGRQHKPTRTALALLVLVPGSAYAATGRNTGPRPENSTAPTFNVDETQTSVSGISSGGFMAVQFQVAFSSTIRGAAIFAGGPYDCAQGSLSTAEVTCENALSAPTASTYVGLANTAAAAGDVDPVSNLAGQNVFLFGGADDSTVAPVVVDSLDAFYKALITTGSILYESRHAGAAHTWPTVNYGGTCSETMSPYMGICNYDGAGKALNQIYGTLNAPSSSPEGTYVTVQQADFLAAPSSHSLGDSAYVYVPASCASGAKCKIHVAFHGCAQSEQSVGKDFYENSGLNVWADTNGIIVVYPQTITMATSNPNGCWDWWGYDSANYAKKSGPQMSMVKAMIDHLASGFQATTDGGTPPATDAGAQGSSPDASGSSDAGAHVTVDAAEDAPGSVALDAAMGLGDGAASAGNTSTPTPPQTGACSMTASPVAPPLPTLGLLIGAGLLAGRRRRRSPTQS